MFTHWTSFIVTALMGVIVVAEHTQVMMPCAQAKLKCAYRTGCGMALQNFMMGCSSMLQQNQMRGITDVCPEICQHALIALTSTDEGKDLMTCTCDDDFCLDSKKSVEICRPQVLRATKPDTVVSCRVAEWICAADPLCSTALDYYNRYCKSMFHGKKCTHRCINSISILRRQEKAQKLTTCKCDGKEEYDCPKIQSNMNKLCFQKQTPVVVHGDFNTNEVIRKADGGLVINSDFTSAGSHLSSYYYTIFFGLVAYLLSTSGNIT